MKLDVYVNQVLVGTLEQVEVNRYVFSYQSGVASSQMVSLLMPVRTESWVHATLHPVFQVSLPEGALKQLLTQKFAKHFDYFGDMELLSVVGAHLVGRIKLAPHGATLLPESPCEDLQTLLKSSAKEIVARFLEEHADTSGVSGGFPKFLAKSPISGTPEQRKNTLIFDHWIIKSNDDDHPHLILNEYFGLSVAQKMGLPVPEFRLSDDAKRLAIRRFDVLEPGINLAFEDMCAMLALNAGDKFSGSVEKIIKKIVEFCPLDQRRAALDQFYAQYLVCMAIRNGDAHLKNFGFVYSSTQDVRLSPVFDMLSMSVYAPRAQDGDALDAPALSFGGVKRWFVKKSLQALADRCFVAPKFQAATSARLVSALLSVAQDVVAQTATHPGFAPTGQRMLELWSYGCQIHSADVSQQLKALAASLSRTDPVLQSPR
jgi:serine/threonine-protein kinase HipA